MNNLYPVLSNESKGVILGIILYISKHLSKLSGLVIRINLSKYINPLTKLFNQIKWIGPNSDLDPDFVISIGTKLLGDLNINLIDSINLKLLAQKIHLLPYYNVDNPLIMYISEKKKQDIQKIKSKIVKFNNQNKNWDSQIEDKILKLYFSRSNVFTEFKSLTKYINELFAQVIIKKKKQISNIPIPNYMPNFFPIVFSTDYRQQIKQIKEMIEKKENKYKGKYECDDTNNLKKEINDLRKIIELLNENIQALESNTTSALGFNQSGGNPTKVKVKDLDKLITHAIKLSNKLQTIKLNIVDEF